MKKYKYPFPNKKNPLLFRNYNKSISSQCVFINIRNMNYKFVLVEYILSFDNLDDYIINPSLN